MARLARRNRLGAAALLVAGVAAVAVILLVSGGSSDADPAGGTHRALATREAAALLARVRLPAGAIARPVGDGPVGDPGPLGGLGPALAPNAVQRSVSWTIPEPLAAVRRYLAAHPPRRLRPGAERTFADAAPPAGVSGARLRLQAFAAGPTTTIVRARAQVTAVVTRAVTERVPVVARELEISRAIPGRPAGIHIVVSDPRRVAAIARRIDALAIVQPGAIACPPRVPGLARVTFTFRARPGGTVLARVGEDADVIASHAACEPLDFSLAGRAQAPLLGGPGLLRAVSRQLGVRLWLAPYAA